jgi:hypothetical protein
MAIPDWSDILIEFHGRASMNSIDTAVQRNVGCGVAAATRQSDSNA